MTEESCLNTSCLFSSLPASHKHQVSCILPILKQQHRIKLNVSSRKPQLPWSPLAHPANVILASHNHTFTKDVMRTFCNFRPNSNLELFCHYLPRWMIVWVNAHTYKEWMKHSEIHCVMLCSSIRKPSDPNPALKHATPGTYSCTCVRYLLVSEIVQNHGKNV